MRLTLALSALVLSTGASAAPPQVAPVPKVETPAGALPSVFRNSAQNGDQAQANCRGRIVAARAERSLPKLPEDGAKPGDPLFIAAVDTMIDSCEVLVMRDNLSDIRPLPQFQNDPGKIIPLGGQ